MASMQLIIGLYLATGLAFGAVIHAMNVEAFYAEGITTAQRTEAFLHIYGWSLILWPMQLVMYVTIRVLISVVRKLP